MKNIFNDTVVDRNSPIPYYYQIKDHVKRAIDYGFLVAGDLLPPEDEIATIVHVSRPTVRQAFKELEAEGYLDRQRAKGTFITNPQVYENYLNKLESFYHEMIGQGKEPVTKVVQMKVVQNEGKVKEFLKCEKSVYLERIRYVEDIPVVYLESYIPYDLFSEIFQKNMEVESMYDVMTELNQPVQRVVRTIQAHAATSSESKALGIAKKSPILYIITKGFSTEDKPLEYSIARYEGNSNMFSIELTR